MSMTYRRKQYCCMLQKKFHHLCVHCRTTNKTFWFTNITMIFPNRVLPTWHRGWFTSYLIKNDAKFSLHGCIEVVCTKNSFEISIKAKPLLFLVGLLENSFNPAFQESGLLFHIFPTSAQFHLYFGLTKILRHSDNQNL